MWKLLDGVFNARVALKFDCRFGSHTTETTAKLYADKNKTNLRDLIAATGLVILLKFDPNHRFLSRCDLEIWWMTSKQFWAHLLNYIKLCASYQILRWIRIGVTVRKRPIWIKFDYFFSRVTLKLLCASFRSHWWIQTGVTVRKRPTWVKFDDLRAVWSWNLTDDLEKRNRAPLLCYFKRCASFRSH